MEILLFNKYLSEYRSTIDVVYNLSTQWNEHGHMYEDMHLRELKIKRKSSTLLSILHCHSSTCTFKKYMQG